MFTEIPRERRVSFATAAMFEYSDSSTPAARDAPAPGGYDLAQKRTPYLRMSHTVYLSVHTFESIQYYNN